MFFRDLHPKSLTMKNNFVQSSAKLDFFKEMIMGISRFRFSTRFMFGLGIIYACFFAVLVFLTVRTYRDIYQQRVTRVKDVVDVAISLLSEYHERAKKGEFSVEEAQKRAAQRIKNLRYSGKEYFWINDLQPKMIMHPYKPELEGKDLSDLKDPTGKRFVLEFVKICKERGSGFDTYMWPKHEGSKPVPKVSYVRLFEPWNWIIGSGVYIDDVHEALKTVVLIFIASGIGILIIGVLFFIYVRKGMLKPIEAISHGLLQGTEQVANAAGQVSSASQTLAEGSSEQAASIEETSSSLEELSSMTHQNAVNAKECDRIMKEEVGANFKLVEERLRKMQEAIGKTVKAGEETSKIIKTIDEIAFQTNLLALNAAVEAARAGEAGAGFAVVADEVRSLAMRAAEAAKTTANLIEESNNRIKEASQLTGEVAEAIQTNMQLEQKVTELISEVAAASNEQAQGIEQINKAVVEMEKVVQTVASTAEQTASAAEEMDSQAVEMKEYANRLMALILGERGDLIGEGASKEGIPERTQKWGPALANTSTLPSRKDLPAVKRTTGVPKRFEERKEVKPEDIIPLDDEELKKF